MTGDAEKPLSQRCREALPLLQPRALTTKDSHRELYVKREDHTMAKMRMQLQYGVLPQRAKLVFSGHVGSGKSTELYHLKRELEDSGERIVVIYFSAYRYVNLVDLDATGLFEGLARAVNDQLTDLGAGWSREELERRQQEARESYRRVRRRKDELRAGAVMGLEAGVAQAKVGADSGRGQEESWEFVATQDPGRMLDLLNELLDLVRERRRGAEVLLLVDDLEKMSLATARQVFSDGLAIAGVDAAMVITAPIALLYSADRRPLLEPFSLEEVVLPIIQVVDRDGVVRAGGVDRLRRFTEQRIPWLERLLTDDAFSYMARMSGGVLKDLLRMLRELCLEVAISEVEGPLSEPEAAAATKAIRNDFLHTVPRDLYPRLSEVRAASNNRGDGMDEDLARLLNIAAVLEYANGDRWFRIHPLADHLLGDADRA